MYRGIAMRICASFIFVLCLIAFNQPNVEAQQRSSFRSGKRYVSAPQYYETKKFGNDRYYRTANRPLENRTQSVLNHGSQPVLHNFETEPPTTTRAPISAEPQFHEFNGYSNFGTHHYGVENSYRGATFGSDCPDYIPFVNGDIFGVSKEECCDEWVGHCECLELTNSRSNCECTNPRRAHWGQGCATGNCFDTGGCSSCSDCGHSPEYYSSARRNSNLRSASRTPVSDYFHPRRR